MKKLIIITLFILFEFLILSNVFCDRGIKNTGNESKTDNMSFIQQSHNSKTDFENIIPQNTFIFLVGNNKYEKESGYPGLTQCINDIRLVKEIFVQCCKVKKENIHTMKDASLAEFSYQFSLFIETLEKESLLIFYFSGHGDKDGSLVFSDGKKLSPANLRNSINSFHSDTVLIIDACYAGNNEGPVDLLTDEQAYRNNCLRIYSSLAHLTAKEVYYKNSLFKPILSFYKEVLGLEDLEGNGYFTALLGSFFSHYQFEKNDNISYAELVYYITNIGKIYTETLAAARGEGSKGSWEEAVYRLNQHPKIHPSDHKISFIQPEHDYIIFQKSLKRYRPEHDHMSLGLYMQAAITLGAYQKSLDIGIMPVISLMYNNNVGWGIIGYGIQTGVQWISTLSTVEYPFNTLIYPLAFQLSYMTDFSSPLYFLLDLSLGIGINQLVYDTGSQYFDIKFMINTGVAAGFNLFKNIGLSGSLHYILFIPYDQLFHLLSPGLEFVYSF